MPYLFLSEFENRLNYLLPNFHDIKNYKNIIDIEIPPALIVIFTVLLLILTVFLHKKCDFEKEYSPIAFIILFSVLASVIFSFSLWNKNDSYFSTVIVVSFLFCFIPTIIKYRRPKIFLIAVLICLISFTVSGFVIYKVPYMYKDYCNADFNENTVKNITVIDNNCPDMKNGDIIHEKTATDILLSGTQNKEGYGFILKINTNKFLPIYRYSYLDTNNATALHSLLYKADSILPPTTAKVSFSCYNHDILNITPDLYNIFLKEISSADSKVWYSLKYPELLKNLDYGQNSYRLFINGDLFYISPAVTPDFFNNVNDRLKKTDFKKDKTYWLAGYIFQGNQKEITDIIEKASTRKITNSTNGGVWLLCDNETEKPLKLIPLTNTECETINTLLKG